MIGPSEFTTDARRLWAGEELPETPLLILDLATSAEAPELLRLPPCPVLGIGSPDHPLAPQLDLLVEPPFRLETIMAQVLAAPLAAAAFVQLLRIVPTMPLNDALTAESLTYAMLQGSAEHARWIAAQPLQPTGDRPPSALAVARSGECMTITLDSPESGNAVDREMRDRLYEVLTLAALDPEVRKVQLRANGKAFSLGAELSEFGTTTDPATAHAIRSRTLPAWPAVRCADKLEAHIQGACIGAGLELAAFARRITATSSAWFQLPELAMGILPGAGGCVSLTRRIGRQRTALLVLSARRLSARDALRWGLVDAIVDEAA